MNDIENTNIVTMSPPWYIFANKIKHTYGCSSLIKINDLIPVCDMYIMVINVSDDQTAFALRQVLPVSVEFGNVMLNIMVFNSKGFQVSVADMTYTPENLAELFCAALKYNPLFEGAVLTEGKVVVPSSVGNVVLVIEKAIVQFFDDDLSELCSNFNGVASDVFKEVTVKEYSPNLTVGFSTADPNCQLQQDVIC